MFKMKRIADPCVSPDGKWVAYTLTTPNVEANRNSSDIWVSATDGSSAKQLTTDPASDRHAAWSPDGKWIAFESTRSGDSQIWLMKPDGSEQKQFTTISTGASTPLWSPNGGMLAFVSDVFPEFASQPFAVADSLNKKKLDEMEKGKVKARLLTQLFFRNWDSWLEGKRQHVFVQGVEGGNPVNITPIMRDGVPRSSTFNVGVEFAFSPDSKEIAYTASPIETREEAWTTNYDIWIVPLDGKAPRQITTNAAADGSPRYSPDGKYIAYRAQATPGFEADRWQLMLFDRATSTTRSLTSNFDSHIEEFHWAADSKTLRFAAEEKASKPIWSVSIAGNDVKKVFGTATNASLNVGASSIVFSHVSAVRPAELYSIALDGGSLKKLSGVNDEVFASLDIPAPESIWFKGAGGTNVQSWIFKPPKMVEGAKYPLVYLVHGGPQGAWMDSWSYRWCPALWAAQGYIVMAPNPRGSSGFGQKFMSEISRDWGGKVFVDLMRGVEYACKLPFVDSTRKAAAGASFGGYMMNWFGAKTGKRFNTLITHSGIYNSVSMYGTTEEVWFDEWEHGIPWNDAAEYAKFSPHTYAKKFSTPMLVIHGEKDYRVPVSQAMELFTMLQRRGIPSKFLTFPDENHWILKPANSKLWHETVFEWLKFYLRKGDATD
jgi:dipeptidyl aminopeptidase/acylaminoacyl peptidase